MGVKSISSGSSTTPEALLDAFRAFITDTTNGWTEQGYSSSENGGKRFAFDEPDGDGKFVLVGHDDAPTAVYSSYSLGSQSTFGDTAALFFTAYHGTYNSGTAFQFQDGFPSSATNYNYAVGEIEVTTIANYWFYCYENPNFAVIVVEKSDGSFGYFYFGKPKETCGTLTNPMVFGAPKQASRANPGTGEDGVIWYSQSASCHLFFENGVWYADDTGTGDVTDEGDAAAWDSFALGAYYDTPNSWSGLPVLFTIDLYKKTDSTNYDPVGDLAFVKNVRIDTLAEKQTVTIGNETWRIFPCLEKGSTESGNNGFAVLESVA